MFDIGFFEIIVFFIICLLIFKPEQLPDIIRSVSKVIQELRANARAIFKTIDKETKQINKELKKPLSPLTNKNLFDPEVIEKAKKQQAKQSVKKEGQDEK